MNLQQKTIFRYKQFFPAEPLRITAEKTGIQITRVFRLFSGRPMKVEELEVFETLITNKIKENPAQQKLTEILENSSLILTNSEIEKLLEKVERKIKARTYSRLYVSLGNDEAIQTA